MSKISKFINGEQGFGEKKSFSKPMDPLTLGIITAYQPGFCIESTVRETSGNTMYVKYCKH